MSKPDFSLNIEVRTDAGKGASRRLRRAGKVPGIVYGGHKDPVAVTLDHTELQNHLQHEAFYSHILQLKQGKEEYQAILKDLQRHPYKPIILHADFMRVSANEEIRVSVPLRFLNEATAVGVKMQGGTIFRVMTQIEVFCLPKDLPEYIEVDLADLEVGGLIHISDIKLPQGVRSVDLSHGPDHDQAVATIQAARVSEEAAEGEEGGGEEASGE